MSKVCHYCSFELFIHPHLTLKLGTCVMALLIMILFKYNSWLIEIQSQPYQNHDTL